MKPKTKLSIGAALVVLGLSMPTGYWVLQSLEDIVTAERQNSAAEALKLDENPLVGSSNGAGGSGTAGERLAIAKLIVPRFGNDWTRVVYEGTSVSKVLTPLGVGHYSSSQLPGEPGNFALAAHRAGSGGPFRLIDKFEPGDLIYVETAKFKYTFAYLESKIVEPSDVGVIASSPVGLSVSAKPLNDAFLTLTSCTPIHVNSQRFIAWFGLVKTEALANLAN
jgi:sortase A